jgi:hypothetical protein
MVLPEFARVARTVVDDLLSVKFGEDVVILTDSRTPYEISNFLREAAIAVGARATLIELPKPPFRKDYDFAFLPPDPVSAAIREADAIINLSLGYSGPLVEAIGPPPKARGIFLGQGDEVDESLVRTVAEIDIQKLRERVNRIKELWQGSSIARVTSKLGTDVTVDIRGVIGVPDHGFTRPEGPRYAWLPPGICSIIDVAPMDGTLVFNGICHAGDIHGIPDEPIRMKVKSNLITDVKGDRILWPQMKRYLDSFKDPKVYSIPAHIGIGLNPNAMIGKGTEWERVEGAVLFGIGDNSALSKLLGLTSNRTVKASAHWDCQMFGATLHMNDTLVVDEGKVAI